MRRHPAGLGQAHDHRSVESTRCPEIDVLHSSLLTQLGRLETQGQSAAVAGFDFTIDQQAEPFGWVDLGGSPPRPPGRSGHAQFGHPAPQITDSLRDAGGNGWQRVAVADEPARTAQTFPRTISLSESAY